MNKLSLVGLTLATLLLLVNPAPAVASSTNEIVQLVNQLRADHGLTPYQVNSALTAAAQNHANWMSQTGLYTHAGAGGSTPQTRANAAGYVGFVVENIVGGTNMTPRQGVIWWQNSPIHYNTLVSTRYTQVGVGFATNGQQNFYVLVAGVPSSGGASPTNPPQAPPLIITPIQLAEPAEDGSVVHLVQPGQALWSLAAHYQTPLAEILLLNNLRENVILQPGDRIWIRLADGMEPPPTPTPPLTHRVEAGQTLWTIASRYRVRLADLLWYNGLGEEDILQPGQEIVVRMAEGQTPPPTPTPQTHHIVRAGQTLSGIALMYGLTVDQLLVYNGIAVNKALQIGEELRIRPPDPTETPTPPPPTFTPTPPPSAESGPESDADPIPAETPPAPIMTETPTPTPPTAVLPDSSSENGGFTTASLVALLLGLLVLGGLAWAARR